MAEEIRLGFCGAGKIVETHLAALERVEGMSATAVSSRTKKNARRLARRFKVPVATDDHQQVIDSPQVDVVFVAAPNYLHAPLVIAATQAGKHVIVEKPLATNLVEGKKMAAAVRKAGVELFYAEQLPLAPKSQALAAAVAAGEFGDLHFARQVERHSGPYSPWFFRKETAGGGVLVDLGCHSISVLLDLLPGREIEAVSGLIRTYRHTDGDVEDFSLVRMEFAGGAVAEAENSWCYLGGFESVTEVYGAEGNAVVDIGKGSGVTAFLEGRHLGDRDGEGGWHSPQHDPLWENGYIAQFEAIKATLREGAPYPQTVEDGLRVLRIMTAAYQSAARGGRPARGPF
ncbi:MAG: Gfo/Idh/MocA family oxidoreductase [Candidatus Lernaella stagnicola]|nr:Gfo/Idh/MocA family oxidoreductase [Candidatus Lernaella stagnicola]